jgi:hypothetical protein
VGFADDFLPLDVLDEAVLLDLEVVFEDEDLLAAVEAPLFVVDDLLFDDFCSSGVNECADGIVPTSREPSKTAI